MKKMLFMLFLVMLHVDSFSQANQVLTLPEALAIAAKQYPFLKAKLAEKNISDEYLKASKTIYLPDVVLQHQYQYATNNSEVGATFPNDGSLPSVSGGIRKDNIYQAVWGSFSSLQVNWRAFTFGKNKLFVDMAQKETERQSYDYENEVFQHQIRVADAYLALLVFQKVKKIQEVNLKRAETFQNVINANVLSGLRPGIDSSVANAEVSKAKLLLFQSRQNERSQRILLGQLVGNISGTVAIDSANFYKNILLFEKNYSNNVEDNPLLKVYRSQIDFFNIRTEAIRKSFLPNINLNASVWGRGSGVNNLTGDYNTNLLNGVGYQVGNYLLGVGVRWNLTPFYRIRHEVSAEKLRVEQFQQLLNEQELRLQRQSEDANMQIELARQQALEAPTQTAAARAAFRQATARYESGLATLPELSQAFSLLNRAEVDQSVANNNVWRALLLKAAALGDLSILLNQIKP